MSVVAARMELQNSQSGVLASAGAELRFRNRVSAGAHGDGEFAERTTKYSGKGVALLLVGVVRRHAE
ncbi:MAG: hypothetical protein JWR89_1537 [Tardiphaga sp.]|nr:hypothetical protein [Tardiphaga sp.]